MPKTPTPTQGSDKPYNPNSIFDAITSFGSQSVPVGGTASPYQQPGAGTNLVNALANYANQAMSNMPTGGAVSPYQQYKPPTMPAFAQVTEDDKSMDDFAARNNVPLEQVTTANNTKSLPPKGTYMQLVNQGVPPSIASTIAGGGITGLPGQTAKTNPNVMNRGGEGLHRLTLQANQIMQQWKTTGVDPVSIPSAVIGFIKNANGEPLTIQAALQMGYVMNENGILVKSGTPGAPGATSANNWETNPALNIVTWNRNAKNPKSRFQTTEKWAANAYRRKMGKGKNQRPGTAAPVGPTSTEGPSSVLDIHLGSG